MKALRSWLADGGLTIRFPIRFVPSTFLLFYRAAYGTPYDPTRAQWRTVQRVARLDAR